MNPATSLYLLSGLVCVLIHWLYFEPFFTKRRDKGYMTKQVMLTIFAFICPIGYFVGAIITQKEMNDIKKRESK